MFSDSTWKKVILLQKMVGGGGAAGNSSLPGVLLLFTLFTGHWSFALARYPVLIESEILVFQDWF